MLNVYSCRALPAGRGFLTRAGGIWHTSMETAVELMTRGTRGAGGKGRRREGACEDPEPGNSAGERRDWGGIRLRPSAHALRSPRGFPPPNPQEARSRLSKVFPGLRNEGQGPPLRREPPKRTYTGLRASSGLPHSGILTAATTSARAANPLLRSPNGRSTPVKPHALERAPPGSASLCLPLANRKSRLVTTPPPLANN